MKKEKRREREYCFFPQIDPPAHARTQSLVFPCKDDFDCCYSGLVCLLTSRAVEQECRTACCVAERRLSARRRDHSCVASERCCCHAPRRGVHCCRQARYALKVYFTLFIALHRHAGGETQRLFCCLLDWRRRRQFFSIGFAAFACAIPHTHTALATHSHAQ